MTKVSNFLRALALSADEIAAKSKLPAEHVKSILAGEDASLADLRALARGLKIPIRQFAGADPGTSELAMLFRSASPSGGDLGVERFAAFVQAALAVLPPRRAYLQNMHSHYIAG